MEDSVELQTTYSNDTDVKIVNFTSSAEYNKGSKLRQFRAMFLKNLSLQKRRKGTNCCQCFVPLALVILIGALNLIIQTLIESNSEPQSTTVEPSFPMDVASYGYTYFRYTNQTGYDLGSLGPNGEKSGMLGTLQQREEDWDMDNTTKIIAPYFVLSPSREELDTTILDTKKFILDERRSITNQQGQQQQQNDESYYNQSNTLPVAGILFNRVESSGSYRLEYTVMAEETNQFTFSYHPHARAYAINLVHNAFLQSLNLSLPYITAVVQQFPFIRQESEFDITGFLTAFLFPFAFSFLLPVYVYNIVQEKQEKLIEMMKMMGLKMGMYWLINFIYNFVLYIILTALVILIGAAFQIPSFTLTDPAILITLFLGWGINQICFGFLLSTLFSKARVATVVCYLGVVLSILASIALNQALYTYPDEQAPSGYFVYPLFAFYRGIYLTGMGCVSQACPKWEHVTTNYEWRTMFLVLWIEAPIFLVLALYLEEVLPKQYGVRKSPFFPFEMCIRAFRKTGTKKTLFSSSQKQSVIPQEDSDVAEERAKVQGMTEADLKNYPVIVKNLRKEFHDKTAVVDSCFALQNNEVFGLLGPNGAGKTTTISMLTGLFMPTSGYAAICGYDIQTEMDKVHQEMGVCPQFDTLWDTLTAEETILFYCRLKGISKSHEKEETAALLRQVGLYESRYKLVKELSGGMKRRLSIAVSLAGNPAVVFLDEPTTGLDPESRRQLWNLLLQVRTGRLLFLTTHSMEEADTLCTKIAIMSRGALRCLGTPVRLKNKFGQGYTLKINFDEEDEEVVVAGIKQLLPTAQLEESFPGNFSYSIPTEDLVMSKLLNELITRNDELKITDWGITQSTLEDVFLNIVKNDETDEETKS